LFVTIAALQRNSSPETQIEHSATGPHRAKLFERIGESRSSFSAAILANVNRSQAICSLRTEGGLKCSKPHANIDYSEAAVDSLPNAKCQLPVADFWDS
jgi:hypothetical protein